MGWTRTRPWNCAPGSPAERGDHEAERLALEQVVEQAPGNARALERLATLAFEAGQPDRAGELRRRKAEVDRIQEGYRKLLAIDATTVEPADRRPVGRIVGTLVRGPRLVVVGPPPGARGHRGPRRPGPAGAQCRSPAPRPIAIAHRPHPGRRPLPRGRPGPPRVAFLPDFSDDAEAAGLRFAYDNGRTRGSTPPGDHGRWGRPARLRRRRLARRLLRPGGAVPALAGETGGDPGAPTAIACSATGVTGRSRM